MSDTDADVLVAAGNCPTCGGPAVRVATHYPTKGSVVCAAGHDWEVLLSENVQVTPE